MVMRLKGRMGRGLRFFLVLTLVFGIVACGGIARISGPAPFPGVEALPNPKLPDWIEQISPLGQAEPLAQVRIRFKEPLIPVESLDNPNQQDLLKKFEIIPPIAGQFRFLTPRMVGFQSEELFTKATRFRVTLKSGLGDLKNHRLTEDLVWTFNTPRIEVTNLPGQGTDQSQQKPIGLEPKFEATANVALDVKSLEEHARLIPLKNGKDTIALKVSQPEKPKAEDPATQEFNPDQTWTYTLNPAKKLEKGTQYRVEISPGLRPERGNLPTESPITTRITTYSPLEFTGLSFIGLPDAGGTYGRFTKGSARLKFNNAIPLESAIEHVKVSPNPKDYPPLVRVYEGEGIDLNPWALEPVTTYTVTIDGNLKDEFGQTLGKTTSVKYETGDAAPDFWAPSGFNIFPAGKDLELNISSLNLPDNQYQATYRVLQPTDLVYHEAAFPQENETGLLSASRGWQSYRISGSKKNQAFTLTVPLKEKLGGDTGMLAYGVKARANSYRENNKQQWREPAIYGMVQLTNLGVFSQWFPDSGLVRVHHLEDGSAVANAAIDIYKSRLQQTDRPIPTPCATGRTDATGTLVLNQASLSQCIREQGGTNSFSAAPELLVIARENKDWAFARSQSYSGAYGFGIYADWQDGKPQSRGTIFSDRQLYQSGETAWLTGAAYFLQNDRLQQDKNARYQVTLRQPNGAAIDLGSQTTNEFGTFSLEVPLKATQPLGYYSVEAKGTNGNTITGEFRVAEFKPPNFKVDLNLNQTVATPNQKVEAKTQSNYLFGPPVEGGKVKYYVTREAIDFVPKGWETFSFGRQWFWPEDRPSVSGDVLEENQTLSKEGQSSQTVTVGDDIPYPMTYRVDAEVSDVSNLSVADTQMFTALPADRLIGLKSDFVAEAGKPFSVEVVVTDPTGKVLEGQTVRLELQEMKYSSVTRVVEGSMNAQNQVEYKTVGTAETRSGTGPQTVSLTPSTSGSYRIRANFADRRTEATATDTQLWVTGNDLASWGDRYRNNRLEVKLDRESYQVGDTAIALIQSPYPEAELYFAVIRNNTLYQQVIPVKGGAPQVQFTVTPEMLPNAAVEAVLVRRGQPLSQVEPGSLDELVKVGFAPFKTDLKNEYLQVQIQPGQTELAPGAEQTVSLTLQDLQGQPVKGQLTVMAVNEAILQLSGYRLPDLVETVYAEQSISTRFADNRPDVVLEPIASPLQKGWGYGGGRSAGAANTRTRKDFRPLAFYQGSVMTDEKGQAQVRFKVPDDLTTWRVMAVAATEDLRFGRGDTTFLTTQPLLTNPVLPQFARPGDRIQAGLSVTNATNQSGNLSVLGEVKGSIQFEENNQTSQQKSLQTDLTSGTQAYRFPLVATEPGEAIVKFTTATGTGQDAFEVPLPIKPLEITEQVVEVGATTNKAQIPLNIDRNVVPNAGGLDVTISSTLMPAITAPVQQLLEEEQLPFLEPAASQLTIAASLQQLSQQYRQAIAKFDVAQQTTQAIERLQKLQRDDGGFSSWPNQPESDPYGSVSAAQAIGRATRAGLAIDPAISNRLRSYLNAVLANPGQYEYCKATLCKAQLRLATLTGLADLGSLQGDFLADIYQQRTQLNFVAQIQLARHLSRFPEWQSEGTALANQIQELIYQTGRSAQVNLPQRWQWFYSPVTAQAEALQLFVTRQSQPEMLGRLVQGLLTLRRNGTWQTSADNAKALSALVDYLQLQPTPPNFNATVQLAGKALTSTRFQGYDRTSQEVQVPMKDLPQGRRELTLQKSGQGTLHYQVAYRYRLAGNPPGRFNGLRVVREIRSANETNVLRRFGMYPSDEALTVNPGEVFEISLEVTTDHPVDHVVMTDPLPAGLEAVDTTFQTSTPALRARSDSWEIDYQTIHRDRVVAYSDRLEPGVYSLRYLVRSVTPGTYSWPGSEAHLQYAPEEFGRSASSTVVVK
ncbi:MAG: alpha-2-macroglobulin [Leptolyngbyaceae cyanobacterium bins.59]|nr:alpha-2-macroglobulin [Leptolyngbyaceae cyanobacterium bins.59]